MPTNNTTKGDFKSPTHSRRITTSSERRKRHPVFTYTICLILAVLSGCFPWSKTFKEKDVLVKYGTDDPEAICLLKNGLSLSLSLLLIDRYRSYLEINVKDSIIRFMPNLIEAMEQGDENHILIYEVKNCM